MNAPIDHNRKTREIPVRKLRFDFGTLPKHWMGESALGTAMANALNLLDAAPQAVRDLLRWHAAEEIEHKSVAFDVLMRVNPGYVNRVLGLALATATLGTGYSQGSDVQH